MYVYVVDIKCTTLFVHVGVTELVSWKSSLRLTIADRMILESGQWLTANHISAAHKALTEMHPTQNGLQDTSLLSEKGVWKSGPKDFIQIIHVGKSHWACLSNVFSESGSVDLYDSLHTIPSEEGSIVRQACIMMRDSGEILKINVVDVQVQSGFTDCGLFAIAMAIDLCARVDPYERCYSQSLMRQHLTDCFENGDNCIEAFPSIAGDTPKRIIHQVTLQLFCVCQMPEMSRRMVCCDLCETWYHEGCVPMSEEVFTDDEDLLSWMCCQCM